MLHKLKEFGITGALLDWFQDYLSGREQRVVIGGSSSNWALVKAGVPQGSILGPLLFIIYINDIIRNIQCEILLFADDTSILETLIDPILSISRVNADLETLRKWASQWLVTFNPMKTKYLIFSKKLNRLEYPDVHIGDNILKEVDQHKQLGIIFNNKLTWDVHINEKCKEAGKRLSVLRKLPDCITPLTKLLIYKSFIRPVLEYGSVLFDNCTVQLSDQLENVQRQAMLKITRAYIHTSQNKLLAMLGLETLKSR